MLCLRARAGTAGEPAKREMAQRALVTLANQLEQTRTLSDVVVRLRQAIRRAMERAAQTEEFSPGAGHCARVNPCRDISQPRFRFWRAAGGEQRFARDQIRLNRFGWRCFCGNF